MRLEAHESAFAYVRTLGRTRAWVVLNFSADVVEVPLAATTAAAESGSGPGLNLGLGLPGRGDGCRLVLCNYGDASVLSRPGLDANVDVGEGETTLALRGYEARVYVG